MVSRLERLADQNRALHQQACALIIAGQGTAIDTLPILGDLKELYQDCLRVRPGTHDARAMRRIRTM
ncbi:hypothetical protein, partial [Methylobacterium sp. CCH7-A2]|uniref:hypothetical protein n=1 Tax=Methylobacterium sp. CCH7-A2 TaxID=1768789 RepID=UPI000AC37CB3